MNAIRFARRGTTRLGVLCLASAAVVIIPTVALAADGGTPTIRSTIGSDGTVESTTQYTPDGVESPFDGDLPIAMTISHTASGAQQTFSYHVENTFSRTQSLTYTDTAGEVHKTSVQLQLPLVAQLGVDVPESMGAVDAGTATVTTSPDGVRHVLWNMILFTPLGSAVQDVTLTTENEGTPVAELRATAVDPANTPGLSGSSQAATASYQQDDFWAQYAGGADGGLTLIKDGLSQLLAGIVDGADGAQQLADGSAEAYTGSQDLTDGISQIYAGQGDLTKGLFKIEGGQGDLTQGLKKIHKGQGDLTDGLSLIAGGLGQLSDPVEGLPAAIDGIGQLQAGVEAALAGVGDDATPQTILNGVAQISGGLALVIDGIQTQLVPGLQCLAVVENGIVNGASSGAIAANPCYQVIDVSAFMVGGTLPGVAAIDPTFATNPLTPLVFGLAAVTSGFVTQAVAGINDPDPTQGLVAALEALKTGADQLHFGITHPAGTLGASDPGGLKQGLQLINGGLLALLDPTTGLPAAVDGINQLLSGANDAVDGSQQLFDGSGEALAGSRQLTDGSAAAADGSQQLTDGSGEALAGSQQLSDGLGQIADGQAQVAAGLPDAVDGIGQLIDGVGQAQDDAVGPLAKQLTQASQNSHKQLAVLQGAADLAAAGPGGAGATYVLTQSTRDFALAADSSGDSHTARNIGIGVGGAVLLLVGLGAGLVMGRRASRMAA
jgi:putative membrane protein